MQNHAGNIVLCLAFRFFCLRFDNDFLRQLAAGNIGNRRQTLFHKLDQAFAPPAQFIKRSAQSRLRYAVRTKQQAVFRVHLNGISTHKTVRKFFGNNDFGFRRNNFAVSDMQEFGVAFFHNFDQSVFRTVRHGKSRVADLAHLTDGQRVHDDFGRFHQIAFRRDEFQDHRRRHVRQNIGFDSAAQSVGQNGDQAAFFGIALRYEKIPVCILIVLFLLRTTDINKQGIFIADHSSSSCL